MARELHHITYKPRRHFKLCVPHHRQISEVNLRLGVRGRASSTNELRMDVHRRWLQGEFGVARLSRRERAWVSEHPDAVDFPRWPRGARKR